MRRYAALLRGVSPMNAKMAELASAFEAAGFTDVTTVLASGNVVFSAKRSANGSLEKRAEAAMTKRLGRSFLTIVRPIDDLEAILASDPYGKAKGTKRVVTFFRSLPAAEPKLPIERNGATIVSMRGGEVLTVYTPGPNDAAFMVILEKTFGKAITTRTWDTVAKIVQAAARNAGTTSSLRRKVPGATPKRRLKALAKANSDS